MGVYVNKMRVLVFLLQIPIVFMVANCKTIFQVLNLSPEAAVYSEQYIFYFIPGIFCFGQYDTSRAMFNFM